MTLTTLVVINWVKTLDMHVFLWYCKARTACPLIKFAACQRRHRGYCWLALFSNTSQRQCRGYYWLAFFSSQTLLRGRRGYYWLALFSNKFLVEDTLFFFITRFLHIIGLAFRAKLPACSGCRKGHNWIHETTI